MKHFLGCLSLSFLRPFLPSLNTFQSGKISQTHPEITLKDPPILETHYYCNERALHLESEHMCQNPSFISYNHTILDKLFNFSEPPISHLQNKDN